VTVCEPGFAACGGRCVDPASDPKHCGGCGLACESDHVCRLAICSCPDDWVNCGACIDPLEDERFCGAWGSCVESGAGDDCGEDGKCVAGACVCSEGGVFCGGACVDPRSHVEYCGAAGRCIGTDAGVRCGSSELCVEGQCLESDASLAWLGLVGGVLDPPFAPNVTLYRVRLGIVAFGLRVFPRAMVEGAEIRVNESVADSDSGTAPLLSPGTPDVVTIQVVAPSGAARTYRIDVVRDRVDYVKASNPGGLDRFGTAIAIDGDTMVVGAPAEDGGARGVNPEQDETSTDAGAAYVFLRRNEVWEEVAYLKASNARAGDRFGESVAIAGDTIAVAAPEEDGAAWGIDGDQDDMRGRNTGAVYVFRRSGSNWAQQAYVKVRDRNRYCFPGFCEDYGYFGSMLALDGERLAISGRGSGAGWIDVYQRGDGAWSLHSTVDPSSSLPVYGASLDLSGDVVALGMVYGGYGDYERPPYSGSVAIYEQSFGYWKEQAVIETTVTDASDSLGYSVALQNDVLIIGAPGEDGAIGGVNGDETDDTLSNAGAAYVFERSAGTWSQAAYLKAPAPSSNAACGRSVAIRGDFVAMGCPGDASAGTGVNPPRAGDEVPGSGAVVLFYRTARGFQHYAFLKASNAAQEDAFGSSVDLGGDAVIAGANVEDGSQAGVNPVDDDGLPTAGAAYVY
jgi:hypothetical protein